MALAQRLWGLLPFSRQFELMGESSDERGRPSPVAFMVGFAPWKRQWVRHYFPGLQLAFVTSNAPQLARALAQRPDGQVIVWGRDVPRALARDCLQAGVTVWHVEDGFVRSLGLGAQREPGYSLVIDKRGLYFDATRPSDLEILLGNHTFEAALLARAEACMTRMLETGISKYNQGSAKAPRDVYGGPKRRPRVLVLGQVEDDASIRYGCARQLDNAELVRITLAENRDGDVFYKPHPDVLARLRAKRSLPEGMQGLAGVLGGDCSVPEALVGVDHVYTISSLSGFEALMRGIRVTCLGAPFYAGWGLTNDRQVTARRARTLSLAQLFAGAYLLYPQYRDPDSGEQLTLEQTIDRILAQRDLRVSSKRAPR